MAQVVKYRVRPKEDVRQLEVRISTSNLQRPEFPQLWNYLGEFDHDLTVTEPWKDGFYTEVVPIYGLNSG